MKTEKVLKILLTALCAALGIAAAWFVLRFLLVWLLPFILAFFTAALLDPVIRKLASFMRVRRGYAAAVCVTGFIALLAALAALLISRAVYELTSLAQQLPDLISGIPDLLHTLESRHISATERREMGSDIGGACGQLRRRELEGKSKE